jgi:hypothetical protein
VKGLAYPGSPNGSVLADVPTGKLDALRLLEETMSDDLSREELEWVSEIVYQYQDASDWTHHEWAELQTILDKLDKQIESLK